MNKPVLEFDDFMKISVGAKELLSPIVPTVTSACQGCAKGLHTDEALQVEAPKSSASYLKSTETVDGKEMYSSGPPVASTGPVPTTAIAVAPVQPVPIVEEEDDVTIPVKVGTTCRRKGCGVTYESDDKNRIGDEEGTVCNYHPAPVSFIK